MSDSSKAHVKLADLVPAQRLVTRSWLLSHGVPHHTADNLVKAGRLVILRPGVYANPGSSLTWESVVCSLQRMGSNLIVGGITALELHGRNHFAPFKHEYTVNLYGWDPLPGWINRLDLPVRFHRHGTTWLQPQEVPLVADDSYGLRYPFAIAHAWGEGGATLRVSTIERAFFEVLSGVPKKTSFEHAELLLDGLPDLLPRRLNALLARTRSVKVKRLFFWLAKRQRHPWLKEVQEDNIDFGRGKRHLEPGGRLNREYQITVPEFMSGETREFR